MVCIPLITIPSYLLQNFIKLVLVFFSLVCYNDNVARGYNIKPVKEYIKMEKWNVIGYQHVEFDTSDGKHISGTTLFLCRERQNVVGSECCKLFVTPSKMDCEEKDIPIGGTADITFNRYGKADCVTFSF